MAPLYKRYIPPKPSAAPVKQVAPSVLKPVPAPAPKEEPKKRKRERTDEEIAERKAKKLRKKGVDPATALPQNLPQSNKGTTAGAEIVQSTKEADLDPASEPKREFAHVKNTKKRHKLEKEARKARRVGGKADVKGVQDDEANAEQFSKRVNGSHGPETRDFDAEIVDHQLHQPPTTVAEPVTRKKRRKDENYGHTEEADELHTAPFTPEVLKERLNQSKGKNRDDKELNEATANKLSNGKEDEIALSQPRKRRHKLESVLQESKDQAQDELVDDNEHLRKHDGILGKYQKSTKLSQNAPRPSAPDEEQLAPQPVMLDLAPLPQPEKAPTPEFKPDSSSLPAWLAKPTVVSSDKTLSFSSLNLDPKTVEHLSKLGLNDALPVQQGLLPLLLPPGTAGAQFLPGTETVLPDVAVSAPTGSGKTIAYLLPIIESLKKVANIGKLKLLVVVPTRELVTQVAAVADALARGTTIKIGMATGTSSLKGEQLKLIKRGRKYDPEGYQKFLSKADRQNYPPAEDSEEFDDYLDEIESEDTREEQCVRDAVTGLVDHVPTYESAVDILVATPGRLLEHFSSTLGFSLVHLEWLVLDEADKLLGQQYDGFLEMVNNELSRSHHEDEQDARERFLRSKGLWDESRERRVRKVVCSATMTRDISKLVDLKLKRPQMLIVRGSEHDFAQAIDDGASLEPVGVREVGEGFELPPTLSEHCVHVGDGSEKPLYLVELLRTRMLPMSEEAGRNADPSAEMNESSEAAHQDVDSQSGSDSSSDSESSLSKSSEPDSSGSDDAEGDLSAQEEPRGRSNQR